MDVTGVPFNKFLGITRASVPGFLLQLEDSPDYQNHLGTVHAGVQLTLAETTSAECLLQHFPGLAESVLAVVRRVKAKFRNPLTGKIRSRAAIQPAQIGGDGRTDVGNVFQASDFSPAVVSSGGLAPHDSPPTLVLGPFLVLPLWEFAGRRRS